MNYSSYEFRSKKFIYFLTFHANLGSFVTGMFFVALNACIWEVLGAIESAAESERFDKILLSAAIPFGAIFGAWGASAFAVKKGRRSSLIAADVIAVVACLSSVDQSFFIILIGRLLCGIVVGINWTIIPLYVREVSPPDLSGRSGAIFRIMFCAGILLTFIMSLGLKLQKQGDDVFIDDKDNLWKVIFLLPIAFCVLRTLIFIILVRLETPRYYISQNDQENAMLALAQIYTDEQVKSIYSQESRFEDTNDFSEVLSPRFKRQAMIVFLLILVNEFMGTNALTFYSTEIFLNSGKSKEADYFNIRPLNVYFSLVRFLATVVGIGLIDKIGRRPLILYGTILTTLVGALTSLTTFSENLHLGEEILTIIFTGLQSMSLNLVLPIYTAELLPSYGMGLQVIFQMVCVLLVTIVFPYAVTIKYAFMVFTAVGVFSFIPMLKLVKETKGKTLNEIYRLFHAEKDSGLLDEEVVEEEFSPYSLRSDY